jgi:hypothetical protein
MRQGEILNREFTRSTGMGVHSPSMLAASLTPTAFSRMMKADNNFGPNSPAFSGF